MVLIPRDSESDGQWRSFEFHSTSPESLLLQPIPSPMKLSGLSFIEKSPGATASHHNEMAVSTLSLGSSFALLCGGLAQSQDLVVLLWDLRYSVVLASHRFPIPTNLTASKAGISLELMPASNTQVLLSLSSRPQGKTSKLRSAVYVVPVTVPATSTIATAMGRASSSAKWLVAPNGGPLSVSFSSDRRGLLNKLRSTIKQNDPEAADSAFFDWLANKPGSLVGIDVRIVCSLLEHVSIDFVLVRMHPYLVTNLYERSLTSFFNLLQHLPQLCTLPR
jgi:hypothetical protein